jgi:hypothetical protein
VLILVENFTGSGHPQPGLWTIEVTPTERATQFPVHAWIYTSSMGAGGEQGFTNSHVVGSPGTANRAITVGAYVPRQCWTSLEGTRCWVNQEPIEDIAEVPTTADHDIDGLALTTAELRPTLDQAQARSAPVDLGACAA